MSSGLDYFTFISSFFVICLSYRSNVSGFLKLKHNEVQTFSLDSVLTVPGLLSTGRVYFLVIKSKPASNSSQSITLLISISFIHYIYYWQVFNKRQTVRVVFSKAVQSETLLHVKGQHTWKDKMQFVFQSLD